MPHLRLASWPVPAGPVIDRHAQQRGKCSPWAAARVRDYPGGRVPRTEARSLAASTSVRTPSKAIRFGCPATSGIVTAIASSLMFPPSLLRSKSHHSMPTSVALFHASMKRAAVFSSTSSMLESSGGSGRSGGKQQQPRAVVPDRAWHATSLTVSTPAASNAVCISTSVIFIAGIELVEDKFELRPAPASWQRDRGVKCSATSLAHRHHRAAKRFRPALFRGGSTGFTSRSRPSSMGGQRETRSPPCGSGNSCQFQGAGRRPVPAAKAQHLGLLLARDKRHAASAPRSRPATSESASRAARGLVSLSPQCVLHDRVRGQLGGEAMGSQEAVYRLESHFERTQAKTAYTCADFVRM